MGNCKAVSTPFATHFKVSAESYPHSEKDIEKKSHVPHSNSIGSLMYSMVCSRPNLSHPVSMISRYMHNPDRDYWETVK